MLFPGVQLRLAVLNGLLNITLDQCDPGVETVQKWIKFHAPKS